MTTAHMTIILARGLHDQHQCHTMIHILTSTPMLCLLRLNRQRPHRLIVQGMTSTALQGEAEVVAEDAGLDLIRVEEEVEEDASVVGAVDGEITTVPPSDGLMREVVGSRGQR